MTVMMTGATGFLGGAILRALAARGDAVRALGRRAVPDVPSFEWKSLSETPPLASLKGADAVIHLAGEPVAQRWNDEVKRRILDSRVAGTRSLVRALHEAQPRPKVLVCASATGIYGDRGEEILTEASTPASGFLAQVTQRWEEEAGAASELGMRVVKIRIGIVLGQGGALKKMLPPFQVGLGGKLGSGRQWMPWIHVDDIVGLFCFALDRQAVAGAVNAAAPEPVRNADFTRALAEAVHRPAFLSVPEFALRLIFGEMSGVMLASERVLPEAAERAGYRFAYPELVPALKSLDLN